METANENLYDVTFSLPAVSVRLPEGAEGESLEKIGWSAVKDLTLGRLMEGRTVRVTVSRVTELTVEKEEGEDA